MTEPGQVTVTLSFSRRAAARLVALADPNWTERTIEAVLYELADHAQQAVFRPGSWQREWACQAFRERWLENLEPDPDNASAGWQRPRNDA
jgi:glutamine synthetase type III